MAANPYRIKQTVKGDPKKIIPELVNEHGQLEAARILGISQATISRWLKRNGYVAVTTWLHESQLEPVLE